MTDYTPTTEQVREAYVVGADPEVTARYRAEFHRWLSAHEEEIRREERDDVAAIEAAAEQRGAVKALKESANEVRREMRWQYEQNISRNSDTGDSIDRLLELEKVFKYRADQMEGDE